MPPSIVLYMKMEEKQSTYWPVLARYFSGDASEEEKEWILRKRKQEKDFDTLFLQTERLWQKAPASAAEYEPDVNKGWQQLQLKSRMREEANAANSVRPGVVAEKTRKISWAVAASLAFLLSLGSLLVYEFIQPEWVEVKTALNETKLVELADGSRVSLNENSSLAYPTNFQHESREVRLKGEAYFEVEKAEGKRFTVFAEGTKTEVIGTAFYLSAYPEEEVKIQVTEGKVAFASTLNQEAVFLTPGQEAVWGKSRQLPLKAEIKDENFQAWHRKELVFRNTRLDQLVAQLEQYFDVSISIRNPALHNCHFSVSFQNPELGQVLEIIALTGNLTISKNQEQYVISGDSCK